MDIYISLGGGYYDQFINEVVVPHNLETFVLVSYLYGRNIPKNKFDAITGRGGKIMIDSGAFTFMKSGKKIVWEEYAEQYAEWVKQNNMELFMELDIDSLIGFDYERVKQLRNRIEKIVGKQSIPVWHYNRGADGFIEMCKKYPYVAVGGLVLESSKYKRCHDAFPWFIKTAHSYGAKIHALGFTDTKKLHEFHFDSADSSTWNLPAKYGRVKIFNGKYIQYAIPYVKGERLAADKNRLIRFSLLEWVKFQQYAKIHL